MVADETELFVWSPEIIELIREINWCETNRAEKDTEAVESTEAEDVQITRSEMQEDPELKAGRFVQVGDINIGQGVKGGRSKTR